MKNNIVLWVILSSSLSLCAMEFQMDEEMDQAEQKTLIITNQRSHSVWAKIFQQANKKIIVPFAKKVNDKGRFYLDDKEVITIHYEGHIKVKVWDNQYDANHSYFRKKIVTDTTAEFCIEPDYPHILSDLLDAGAMQK